MMTKLLFLSQSRNLSILRLSLDFSRLSLQIIYSVIPALYLYACITFYACLNTNKTNFKTNMKNYLILAGTFMMILFSSCQHKKEKEPFIRPVKLVEASSLEFIEKSFPAVVSSDQYSNLAFKMMGPLVAMNVDEGERVKKGEIVAELDETDYRLDLEAKRASYQNALSQLERAEILLTKNAVSIQEYEMTKTAYTNAKSAYELAENVLEDTKLRAPFEGFIQKCFVENYQRVQPGQQIVRLINPKRIQIEFTIPETNIPYITSSNQLYVEFDTYKGKLFKACVKEYVEASPDGSGVPVFLEIDDPKFDLNDYRISVGFSCRVIIHIENNVKSVGVGVPLSAITFDNKLNSKVVYVYDKSVNQVRECPVRDAGLIVGRDEVIVEGDLQVGDLVVYAGATRLVDGQQVKVITD